MAEDDRKDRPEAQQPNDPFSGVDEDDWFAEVDQWDQQLDLPDETPMADALTRRPHTGPVHVGERADDPLVALMDGEMEVDPEGAQALGALLGSEAGDAEDPAVPFTESTHTPVEGVQALSPLDVAEQIPPAGEIADARDDGAVLEYSQPEVVEDQAAGDQLPPEPPPAEEEPPSEPLELLDVLHGTAEAREPTFEPEIEAGQMLPSPPTRPIPASGPGRLSDLQLEDEQAPPTAPPALPEEYTRIAIDELAAPAEAGAAQTPPDLLSLFGPAMQLQADLVDSSRRAADLQLMAARATELSGQDIDAADQYREVLQHQPRHLPALLALWRIHRRRGESDRITEVMEEIGENLPDRLQAGIFAACADRLWTRGENAGAEALLERAPGPSERPVRALMVEVDLARATADEDRLQAALPRLARAIDDPGLAAAVWVELGHLLERRQEPAQAANAFEEAIQREPASGQGWEGLLRCSERTADRATQARALAGAAPSWGDWGAWRLRRLGLLSADPEHPAEAVDPLREAGRIAPSEPLVAGATADALAEAGQFDDAAEAYRLLATLEPEARRRPALIAAALACEQAGDDEEALDTLGSVADDEPIQAASARLRLANPSADVRLQGLQAAAATRANSTYRAMAAELLFALDRAPEARQELLELVDEHPETCLARLRSSLREAEDWAGLSSALDRGANAVDSAVRRAILREQSAALSEWRLQLPEEALARYERVLVDDPGRIPARWGVQRTAATVGRSEEEARQLAFEAGQTEGRLAAELWMRHAAVAGDHAPQSYQFAQQQGVDHAPARWAMTLHHARSGDWRRLVELAGEEAESAGDDAQQRARHYRLGIFSELAGDEQGAARAFESAAAEPAAAGALEALARLGGQAQDAGDLAQQLDRRASEAEDGERRAALLLQSAEARRRAGMDWKEAAERYRRALGERPDSALLRLRLAHLLLEQGDESGLAELLLSEEHDGEGGTQRRAVVCDRLAEVARTGDAVEAALGHYQALLELRPDHVGAHRGRQALLPEGPERSRAAGAEAQAAQPAEAAALWLELARRLEVMPSDDSGDDVPRPEECLEAAVSAGAGLAALLRRIDGAWQQRDSELLARLYTELAATVEDAEQRAVLLARVAQWRGDDVTGLREALELAPSQIALALRLRWMALNAEDWANAAVALEVEAQNARSEKLRRQSALLAGHLARSRREDPATAIVHYRRLNDLAPEDPIAFEVLRSLYQDAGKWDELLELLERRLEIERDERAQADLLRELAGLAKDRLDRPEQALEHLQALLEQAPEETAALAMIADLYEAQGRWSEAADALLQWARLEQPGSETLCDLFRRLGRIYHDEQKDPQRAIAAFRKVREIDPRDLPALQRLADLYLEQLNFEAALNASSDLLALEQDPGRRIEHLLRIAKIHEDGLKDPRQAALALRRASEAAPTDLRTIGALCGYYARQGDQRSMMVHLDRSVATMRSRLMRNPFDEFAYRALFKIFGWRRAPDGCFCAAQVLDALGESNAEEREFLRAHLAAVGAPGSALTAPTHDDWLFHRGIPGGFRHVFQMLAQPFGKIWRGDVRQQGGGRATRVTDADNALRRIGDALARDFGLRAYDLHVVTAKPNALVVENTDPPAVVLGEALVKGATEEELMFLMGRCLWIATKAMILPTRLRPEDLALLVGAVVRQFVADFAPEGVPAKALQEMTKQVSRAIPRKLRQELMPFALECSGPTVDLTTLGARVIHTANRAGLLACRSAHAAIRALAKATGAADALGRRGGLAGNAEIDELLRFAVSDEHFELRRALKIAIQ